jgi:hypothetical protein
VAEFPTAPHTMEWNTDADQFAHAVFEWTSRMEEGAS